MYITTTAAAVATATATAILFEPLPLTRATALLAYQTSTALAVAGNDGGNESKLQKWSSFIGIITAVVGNILISFALNIQRYAHTRLHKEWQEKRRTSKRSSTHSYGTIKNDNGKGVQAGQEGNGRDSPDTDETACSDDDHKSNQEESYLKSPYWWGGIILMAVGETGNFLAYGFAPASIVSPLGVVALVSNCLIAPIMLKERFRWRDFWGVLIAIAGAVTIVFSAKQEDKKLGPHEVIGAITTTAFEVYMGVTIALIVILAYLSPKYGSKTISIDLGLVGLFGGYTALSTKGVASMLSSTLWKAFTTPITYVLILILAVTAVLQVRYVNKALQRFDSTQVIPVQFVMFTISVIVGSAVLYRDFEHADAAMFGKFLGGCLLTFFGVWLITSGRPQNDDDEYDSSDDGSDEEGEERIGLHEQDNCEFGIPRPKYTDGSESEGPGSPSRSRRSSKVSFAVQPNIQSQARRQESLPSVAFSPASPQYGASTPANQWKAQTDELLAIHRFPPSLLTTNSSPVLSQDSQVATSPSATHPPLTRSPLSRTASQNNPHTHPNLQQAGPPQADAVVAQRPVTPRASLSQRILPGPYLSPLGGSLSAVVADTKRRGPTQRRSKADLRRVKSGNQSREGPRALTYNNELGEEGEDGPLLGSSLKQTRTGPTQFGDYIHKSSSQNNATDSRGTKRNSLTRARSLSNTLGAFLGVKKQKRSNETNDDERDRESVVETGDEAGPSQR